MRDNFKQALFLTLRFEGGYSDNKLDPGGATNMGVTLETLSLSRGKAVTKADVRALTFVEAASIYFQHYWQPIKADGLAAGVDLLAFDIAVNMGVGRILKWLAETASLEPVSRIQALHARRTGFWRHLAIFSTFGRGWTNRETAVLKQALALAVPKRSAPVPPHTHESIHQTSVQAVALAINPTVQNKQNEGKSTMILPKFSLSNIVASITALVGLAHIGGAVSLAPGMGVLPGILLLFAAGALAAIKRSKLRDLEAQELARLTNQNVADLILKGQDFVTELLQSKLDVPDSSATMTTAQGLIDSLTTAYQQYPAAHIEAALSAAKAVSAAVQQINAAQVAPAPIPAAVAPSAAPVAPSVVAAAPVVAAPAIAITPPVAAPAAAA